MKRPMLNRRLILEELVRVSDGMGGFVESWVAKGAIWANVNAVGGAESQVGARDLPVLKLKIIVRAAPFGADSRPRPDQRFREGARHLAILAVGDMGNDGQYLEIWAEEGRL